MLNSAFLAWCAWWHAYTGNFEAASRCAAAALEAPCAP